MNIKHSPIATTMLLLVLSTTVHAVDAVTNSIGVDLVLVEAGSFVMGSEGGDFDEKPLHRVTVTYDFYMAATEVTNAQYELFDPAHKSLREKNGFSSEDDEAAKRVRTAKLLGRPIKILSAEDLTLFKLLFFRGKDIVDIERLVPYRGDDLDRDYVRRWLVDMVGDADARVREWDRIVAAAGAG